MAESDFMTDCNIFLGKYTTGLDYAGEGIFLRYKDDHRFFPAGYSCTMTIIDYLEDKAKECEMRWHISFQDGRDSAEIPIEEFIKNSKVYHHVKKQYEDNLMSNSPPAIRVEYTELPYNTKKALIEWLAPDNSNGTIFKQRVKEIRCEL